jgi:hypothetical protein
MKFEDIMSIILFCVASVFIGLFLIKIIFNIQSIVYTYTIIGLIVLWGILLYVYFFSWIPSYIRHK